MEPDEKAKIRMEHWLNHNKDHLKEYWQFADELEKAGNTEPAFHIRRMANLIVKSNKCLESALTSLNNP